MDSTYFSAMKADYKYLSDLLQQTITRMCQKGLKYTSELKVQGLIGVTLDGQEVFLVHINENYGGPFQKKEISSCTSSQQDMNRIERDGNRMDKGEVMTRTAREDINPEMQGRAESNSFKPEENAPFSADMPMLYRVDNIPNLTGQENEGGWFGSNPPLIETKPDADIKLDSCIDSSIKNDNQDDMKPESDIFHSSENIQNLDQESFHQMLRDLSAATNIQNFEPPEMKAQQSNATTNVGSDNVISIDSDDDMPEDNVTSNVDRTFDPFRITEEQIAAFQSTYSKASSESSEDLMFQLQSGIGSNPATSAPPGMPPLRFPAGMPSPMLSAGLPSPRFPLTSSVSSDPGSELGVPGSPMSKFPSQRMPMANRPTGDCSTALAIPRRGMVQRPRQFRSGMRGAARPTRGMPNAQAIMGLLSESGSPNFQVRSPMRPVDGRPLMDPSGQVPRSPMRGAGRGRGPRPIASPRVCSPQVRPPPDESHSPFPMGMSGNEQQGANRGGGIGSIRGSVGTGLSRGSPGMPPRGASAAGRPRGGTAVASSSSMNCESGDGFTFKKQMTVLMSFACNLCGNVYKSQRALLHHQTVVHGRPKATRGRRSKGQPTMSDFGECNEEEDEEEEEEGEQ